MILPELSTADVRLFCPLQIKKLQISREIPGTLTVAGYFNSADRASGTPIASYAGQSQLATARHRDDSFGYTLFEEGLRS